METLLVQTQEIQQRLSAPSCQKKTKKKKQTTQAQSKGTFFIMKQVIPKPHSGVCKPASISPPKPVPSLCSSCTRSSAASPLPDQLKVSRRRCREKEKRKVEGGGNGSLWAGDKVWPMPVSRMVKKLSNVSEVGGQWAGKTQGT